MKNLNSYAFDNAGNKITWEQWYAQCRGEDYVKPLPAFEHVKGSHALYALPHDLRSDEAYREAANRGASSAVLASEKATPANNMGVKSTKSTTVELVINDKGDVVEVPIRFGHGDDSGFIDWLNITFHIQTALRYTTQLSGLNADACVMAISKRLEYLLGFGVTQKRATGSNFYEESYVLGDKWGQVCIGGQNDTILVMLTGSGCAAAAEGWEERVFTFLSEEAILPRITRVDLTFDDIEGQLYSVDQARQDHLDGKFTTRGRPPSGEILGDWDNPNGRGRTKTVGVRGGGKYLRVYEKAMQLGCKFHPWCRIELEMKSSQMCIPFDVLLKAGAYLAASYPALHWISELKADRPKTKKKEVEIDVNKAVEVLRLQFGNYINCLVQMFGIEKLLPLIIRNDKVPERLQVKDYKYAPLALHKTEYEYMDSETIVDLLDVPASKSVQVEPTYKYDNLIEAWLPVYEDPSKPLEHFSNGQSAQESLDNFKKFFNLPHGSLTGMACPF